MKSKTIALFFFLWLFLSFSNQAHASIIINEILADPPAGLTGDANGDGVGSISQDEFVELLNISASPVDLSGWYLTDALSSRHTFSVGTILSTHQFLVVFGGGAPNLPGVLTQVASSSALSLNNLGDQVSVYDSLDTLINQVNYGSEANGDQSLARFPEGTGSGFVLHTLLEEAQGKKFSPGTTIDGQRQWQATSVPEPTSLICLGLGLASIFLKKRSRQS